MPQRVQSKQLRIILMMYLKGLKEKLFVLAEMERVRLLVLEQGKEVPLTDLKETGVIVWGRSQISSILDQNQVEGIL